MFLNGEIIEIYLKYNNKKFKEFMLFEMRVYGMVQNNEYYIVLVNKNKIDAIKVSDKKNMQTLC